MGADSEDNVNDILRKIASVLGASGVAIGALGAHALKDTLTKRGALASFQTGVTYHIFHALAILSLSNADKSQTLAGKLMATGTLFFSGSIYGLSLGYGPRPLLGPITPVGGLLMIGGWIVAGLG